MRITNKQHYALREIARGMKPGEQLDFVRGVSITEAKGGETIDFDILLERLPWKPTKQTAHFLLRALVKKRLIEKGELVMRRRARRRLFRVLEGGTYILENHPPLVDLDRYFAEGGSD